MSIAMNYYLTLTHHVSLKRCFWRSKNPWRKTEHINEVSIIECVMISTSKVFSNRPYFPMDKWVTSQTSILQYRSRANPFDPQKRFQIGPSCGQTFFSLPGCDAISQVKVARCVTLRDAPATTKRRLCRLLSLQHRGKPTRALFWHIIVNQNN